MSVTGEQYDETFALLQAERRKTATLTAERDALAATTATGGG